MRQRVFTGSPFEPRLGISRAVRAGGIIAVSGTAPLGPDGKTVAPGDAAGQARRCLTIIREALTKLGASLSDVVRTRILLTRIEDWEAVGAVHGEFFAGIRPANTVMQVVRFIDPDWLVEIEADAVVEVEAGDFIEGDAAARTCEKGFSHEHDMSDPTGASAIGSAPSVSGVGSADPTYETDVPQSGIVMSRKAPEPVGPYPHARRVGNLLFLSGIGPRKRGTREIPGVTLDAQGNVAAYDIEQQCRSVFENVAAVLEEAGARWEHIVDVTSFLTNIKGDFAAYNRVYAEFFKTHQPARTTVEVTRLPTPIAIELKVIAALGP